MNDAGAGQNDPALQKALAPVPSGAFALAGAAVVLLLAAWLFVYFAIFIPRGPVG